MKKKMKRHCEKMEKNKKKLKKWNLVKKQKDVKIDEESI